MSSVTVLGAGSWGSTLAQLLCDAGNDVLIWGRDANIVEEINSDHTNKKYLDEVILPSNLRATSELHEAFGHSKNYVLAIPAQKLREELIQWKPLMAEDATYISTLKGIERSTLKRMTEVITEITGVKKLPLLLGRMKLLDYAQPMALTH